MSCCNVARQGCFVLDRRFCKCQCQVNAVFFLRISEPWPVFLFFLSFYRFWKKWPRVCGLLLVSWPEKEMQSKGFFWLEKKISGGSLWYAAVTSFWWQKKNAKWPSDLVLGSVLNGLCCYCYLFIMAWQDNSHSAKASGPRLLWKCMLVMCCQGLSCCSVMLWQGFLGWPRMSSLVEGSLLAFCCWMWWQGFWSAKQNGQVREWAFVWLQLVFLWQKNGEEHWARQGRLGYAAAGFFGNTMQGEVLECCRQLIFTVVGWWLAR